MYSPVSRQQTIQTIQSNRANFNFHAASINLPLTYQNGGLKEHYKYPVNTKQCQHKNTQELDQILQTKRCDVCGITISSDNYLVMDIRWKANEIMHPDIEFISIIKGHIFHQFTRPVQYYECFNNPIYQQLVEDLFRNHVGNKDFMQLAREDPQYMNAQPTDYLHYDAICQLDFVKIQIPVRHRECKHVGCYELTSLLAYKEQILASNPEKNNFECLCQCKVKIDLNRLFDLVLDKELLNAIRKAHPHQIKFYLNLQNNQLVDEHTFNNNQDLYIREIYKLKIQEIDEGKYKQFEHDIFSILKGLYSTKLNDLSGNEWKKVFAQSKLQEFQDQNLKLQDFFLEQKQVEYPARCINCNFKMCTDIRTYLANFILKSIQCPKEKFQCPLCSKIFFQTYDWILANQAMQNYIYLDQNLLRRVIEHREYIHESRLIYTGHQNMLMEFQKKHKIFADDVQQMEQIHLNLNCAVSGQRLKIPLLLYKCPLKQYVDFDVFYDELKRIDYDFSVGLMLCKCQTCIFQPITSINDLFYDESFYLALGRLEQPRDDGEDDQPLEQLPLNTKQNLNLWNKFIKFSRLERYAQQVNLENFNYYHCMLQLFKEFILKDEAYFFDIDESMMLLEINKKVLQQQDQNQDIEEWMKTIQQNYKQRTSKPQWAPQTKLYFSFDQNPFAFYLLEKDPLQKKITFYFEEDTQKDLLSEAFQGFISILQQLQDCEDYKINQIVVDPVTLQQFVKYGKDGFYIKYLLTVYAVLYEQQDQIPEVKITYQTVERVYWTLDQSMAIYDRIQEQPKQIETFFDKISKKQYRSIKVKQISVQYNEQRFMAMVKKVQDIKAYFLREKSLKQFFILIEIMEVVSEKKFTYYIHLCRVCKLNFFKIFLLKHYDQINNQMNDQVLEFLLPKDGLYGQKIYIDYARHNFLYEYGVLTLGAWIHLVVNKNLKAENAMALLNLSIAPFNMILTSQD